MVSVRELLRQRVGSALEIVAGIPVDPAIRRSQHGDYQSDATLALATTLRSSPREIASRVVDAANLDDMCSWVEVSGPGFINLTVSDELLGRMLAEIAADERLGVAPTKHPAVVTVDYSAPNAAKEMHVGHLRSTIIGDAAVRLLEWLGHPVIRQNHIGEWGTPFGMLIEHLLDIGETDAAHELSVGDLNGFYRAARQKFDTDSAFADRSRARVVLLQGGDETTLRLWRLLVEQSKTYFLTVYDLLGVRLTADDFAGESTYNDQLPSVVDELEHLGLLRESGGAQCVFPAGFVNRNGDPMPIIVRKSDGGFGYGTTDLATIRHRIRTLHADRLLYVVGLPQAQHLQMIFQTARAAGWLAPPTRAEHIGHGSVLGPDGKILRTRASESVKLVDLLSDAVRKAAVVVAEKNPDLDDATRADVARAVGIGAVKYADLSTDRNKDYSFDYARMLAFDGNTAHFYDVESGRMDLDARGQGANYERFGIPIARDGGIADLLTQASGVGRQFDVVICEAIGRVARRVFEGVSVERALERSEVPLFAANEPINVSGSAAQRILQRRINQSIAEYEVLNTLEQSWGGLCTHVREGWNIGMPPYGYRAKTYRHPNPMKANKGQTKSRLDPDGVRAETVTQIAHWRYHEGLGYETIADRLNADPERHPPPQPPSKARARGAWGKSTIAEILRNPKYTGYQVFNRRATSSKNGKVNDPRKWVWSPEPVHEPLIPKWMYDEINARRRVRQGSRIGDALNSHPATRRSYILRGVVYCVCGRRMSGDRKRDNIYYLCWPPKNNRNGTDIGHQNAIRVREAAVIQAVCDFYADRVFGQGRQEILNADLANVDDSANRERHAERKRLQRTVADLARRQDSVIRQAQEGDPDDPFTKALRNTYNELQAQRDQALARIAQLDAADQDDPAAPTADDLTLLDELPFLKLNFVEAPRPLLRRLFDSTKLSVRLHEDIATVDITVSLPSDQLNDIATAAMAIAGAIPQSRKPPVTETDGFGVDVVRTPDGVRTHARASGRVLRISACARLGRCEPATRCERDHDA